VRRELDQVRRKAARLSDAQDAFRAAVLAAHRAGASYRQIADAAGISHTSVQNIVREES
jgi:DNA-directed RNA polymerase specialized sigma24 family protein